MYDTFKTIEAAKKAYRYCRKLKHFILTDNSRALKKVICPKCGRVLADDPEPMESYRGNRCIYFPKHKKIVGMHYVCSWEMLLSDIAKLVDCL